MVEATLSSTYKKSSNEGGDEAPAAKRKSSIPSTAALFQDAITVNIPIGLTVDLGVAVRRTRKKRIDTIYTMFPSLKPDESDKDDADDEEEDEEGGADDMEGTGGESGEDGATKKKKKGAKKGTDKARSSNSLVPQRHEFGSIMDYLEAKYVRGVMIQNEDDNPREAGTDDEDGSNELKVVDEDDEGQGSVYSESSFLDDRDLQRDVAEQVLAQTTTTKLELEGEDEFFVNVGDLDVEETELTQQHYDPLDDSPKKGKPATKKRKKPSTSISSKIASPAKKKPTIVKKKSDDKAKKKKAKEPGKDGEKEKIKGKGKEKTKPTKVKSKTKEKKDKEKETTKAKQKAKSPTKAPTKKTKKKVEEQEKDDDDSDSSSGEAVAVVATSKKVSKKSSEELKPLREAAAKHRAIMQKSFETVKKMIKELTAEQLPRRRPRTSKVSITCPANKKEGDEVTFANPHIPGQRLRVQVPKGTFPGETFKVSVPVPKTSAEGDSGTDHNKFPRELQDKLDQYARDFDAYCKHEGEFKHANDEEYPIHLEKRKKYDQVVKEFPKNLMTPVDTEYMKKLVRRARQNKSKRSKSAVRRQSGDASAASAPPAPPSSSPANTPPPIPQQTPSSVQQEDASEEEEESVAHSDEDEVHQSPGPVGPTHLTVNRPERGSVFPETMFRIEDFLHAGIGGASTQG